MENKTGEKMLSHHGSEEVKNKYLDRLKAHYAADEIIKGRYWENGKGCAVGCTIHSGKHADYETELGIPRFLARLEDGIFEGLPNSEAKEFPIKFLSAIPVGVDLSLVFYRFMHWLLADPTDGVIKFAKTDRQKNAISGVSNLFERKINGEYITAKDWRAKELGGNPA